MTLSVIGAGFGRTGTLSLKRALEHLGMGPCHHMYEVFNDPNQLPAWQALANGQQADWNHVLRGYRSAVDWPCTHYWRELASAFPQARVILTIRSAAQWWDSFSATIRRLLLMRDSIADEYHRSVLAMAWQIIGEQTFGGDLDNQFAVLARYQERIDDVQQHIAADRLLLLNVNDGWEPLCKFLNLPQPHEPFPKGNSRDQFWKIFGQGLSPDA